MSRSLGPSIGHDSILVPTPKLVPVGTAVAVEILLADGQVALRGRGRVIEHRPANEEGPRGLFVGLKWAADCHEALSVVLGDRPEAYAKSESPPVLETVSIDIVSKAPERGTVLATDGSVLTDDLTAPSASMPPAPAPSTPSTQFPPSTPATPASASTPTAPPKSSERLAVNAEGGREERSSRVRGTEYQLRGGRDDVVADVLESFLTSLTSDAEGDPSSDSDRDQSNTPLARIELLRSEPEQLSTQDLRPLLESESAHGPERGRDRDFGPVLAVDLGTRWVRIVVAALAPSDRRSGRSSSVPAVALVGADGVPFVGKTLRGRSSHSARLLTDAKRLLGRALSEAPSFAEGFANPLIDDSHGGIGLGVDNRSYAAEEILALFLANARKTASAALGREISRAVITCPAHFGVRRRRGLETAAASAGLTVERLLPDSIAAIVARAGSATRPLPSDAMLLVYSLGAGSLDVSVVHVHGRRVEIMAASGSSGLGGSQFDAPLTMRIVDRVRNATHADPRGDPTAMAQILFRAREAKHRLSEASSATVRMDHLRTADDRLVDLEFVLLREEVEPAWAAMLDESVEICESTCRRAGLARRDIGQLLFLGGQTRSPMVRRAIERVFSSSGPVPVEPEDAVVNGAAKVADRLGVETEHDFIVSERLSSSLVLVSPLGVRDVLVGRGLRLPARATFKLDRSGEMKSAPSRLILHGDDDSREPPEIVGRVSIRDRGVALLGSLPVVVHVTADGRCFFEARSAVTGLPVDLVLETAEAHRDPAVADLGAVGALSSVPGQGERLVPRGSRGT